MLHVRNLIIAGLLLGSSLLAQEVSPQSSSLSDQEKISLLGQEVKDLQKQTQELREELNALVAAKSDVPPPATAIAPVSTPATASPTESQPEPVASQTTSDVMASLHETHGIRWRGFGEADYKVLNQRQPELGTYGFVPGSSGSFYTADFGLFLTSKLTEHASVLSEIVFEEGDAQSYKVDLRRVLLNYDINDHLKLSFGRYQTAIGYYNWAYRSAAWLQTTIDRPLVAEFSTNGGILPTQAVGVSVTGSIPSGKLDLNYIAEYGSSDTIRPDLTGDGEVIDENNGNHFNVALFLRPDPYPGLQLGASFYHDKIGDSGSGSPLRYGQTIVNSYVVYTAHKIEFLNSAFLIRHAALDGSVVFNTPAFYAQFARKFGRISPFFRYQYVNASASNSFYDDVGLRFGPSFGARYDLNDYVAMKAQLNHTARRDEPDINGLQLQLAFTF